MPRADASRDGASIMNLSNMLILGSIVAATSLGAAAFKQFTVTRELAWLIAGLAAYNTSNIAWIMLIDQAGLARAMVYSAAGQIVLMTLVGALFGETVGRAGWGAALLATLAVIVASMTPSVPSQSTDETKQTAISARSEHDGD